MLSVCEGLCALGSRRCGVLSRIEPRVRALLKPQPGSQQPHPRALVLLWTLALQAGVDRGPPPVPGSSLDPWSVYRVARQATRYGHFAIAAPLFAALANKVTPAFFGYVFKCLIVIFTNTMITTREVIWLFWHCILICRALGKFSTGQYLFVFVALICFHKLGLSYLM